ncbi:TPA_asm: hypothetical protein, partial [ssRNA phage Gephyllon.3_4]
SINLRLTMTTFKSVFDNGEFQVFIDSDGNVEIYYGDEYYVDIARLFAVVDYLRSMGIS